MIYLWLTFVIGLGIGTFYLGPKFVTWKLKRWIASLPNENRPDTTEHR